VDVTPDRAVPVRAPFRRGRPPFALEAEELLVDVLRGTVGLPLPRRPAPEDDAGTALPARFVVELTADEVRVLDESGDAVVERWPRGHVAAYVVCMDEYEIGIHLRWPDGARAGRVLAEPTPQTREVAELLAADTRAATGVDPLADAELRRLVSAMLSEEDAMLLRPAMTGLSRLLWEDERPLLLAGAGRGLSEGLVLLTDRALRWCAAGRKAPLVISREEITGARSEVVAQSMYLAVERSSGKTVTLSLISPPEIAEAIAAALAPADSAAADAFDELLSREPDETATVLIEKQLKRLRGVLADDERPVAFAFAMRATKIGALLVTDRRVLWAAKKGEPISIELERVVGTTESSARYADTAVLEIELSDGDLLRLDSILPPERAGLIVAALEVSPS
jgi:hypothetical protein